MWKFLPDRYLILSQARSGAQHGRADEYLHRAEVNHGEAPMTLSAQGAAGKVKRGAIYEPVKLGVKNGLQNNDSQDGTKRTSARVKAV